MRKNSPWAKLLGLAGIRPGGGFLPGVASVADSADKARERARRAEQRPIAKRARLRFGLPPAPKFKPYNQRKGSSLLTTEGWKAKYPNARNGR